MTKILWPKLCDQHFVTKILWPTCCHQIWWPNFCKQNVGTNMLWPKFCDQNFVTKIVRQFFFWLKCCDSQLPKNMFQPFKEQKWCPSLGASHFGVNLECFAHKIRIWSKTPNFGVTKNSELRVTTKLVKISIVLNSHTN